MNTTSCDKITRNFLLVLNLAFAVLGLVLIALGFFFHVDAMGILDFLGDDHANPPIFIIILGAIIFVVAFFGCCGAIKPNMQEGMKNYGALDHQGVDFTWDKVQTGLQ